MAYTPAYTNRINWENYTSVNTPINAANLNKMDYALYIHDSKLLNLDTTKANQTDLLQSLKSVTYNDSTGVFIFTYWNDTKFTIDLNVEKIPVNFTMDRNGVIKMYTSDGTIYTADIKSLIVYYNFVDSDTIRFSMTPDSQGVMQIQAEIINGSITDDKLQPQYLADITAQANRAEASEESAKEYSEGIGEQYLYAKSYAVGGTGTRPGEDTDNARYYKETAASIVGAHGHVIVDAEGNVSPSRVSMQFENGYTTDDPTNDITKVRIGITEEEWTEIANILS